MPHNDKAFIELMLDACHANISQGKPTPPDKIFHLTDSDGLLGILKSKTLWSSLATSLNDCMEIRHALHEAEDILRVRLRENASEYYSSLLAYTLDPSSAPPEVQAEVSAFVISFCDRCSKSGQWLHYGKRGRGIAIGFSPEIAGTMKRTLVKIDYDLNSQRTRLASLIDTGRAIVDGFPANMTEKIRTSQTRLAAHIVSLYLPMLAAMMKHPAFREEDEWRLVGFHIVLNGKILADKSGRDEIKYRRSNESLVPYEEVSFAGLSKAITEVVVGYSAPETLVVAV